MKRIVFILFVITFNLKSIARVAPSYYYIEGFAFNKSHVLKNTKLSVKIGDDSYTCVTNDSGYYNISISWYKACPGSGFNNKRVESKLNPKFIRISYKSKTIKLKNRGFKYAHSGFKKNLRF